MRLLKRAAAVLAPVLGLAILAAALFVWRVFSEPVGIARAAYLYGHPLVTFYTTQLQQTNIRPLQRDYGANQLPRSVPDEQPLGITQLGDHGQVLHFRPV
jgi:hypothetical protein